jgi:hypothetical protein
MKKKGEICGKKNNIKTLIIFNYGKQIFVRF